MKYRNSKGQFVKGIIPWSKTHSHSEESLEKMSKTWFPKGHISWSKGKKGLPAYWKGKKMSQSACEKMRKADRTLTSGANHYNWKGGVTPEWRRMRNSIEHKLWRKAVFERDDYTCQVCFERGIELHADHIKSFAIYPELRFAIDNGRTLCVSCHKKTESFAGKIRSTKDYQKWLENRS